MKKSLKILCFTMAFTMLLSACGSSDAPEPTAASGGSETASETSAKTTLVKRAIADQKTYDPYKSNDVNDMLQHYSIYDCLFREEPDGSIVPNLCTDYSFNDEGDELTMTIREGVKFHNGETMTVEDVVFSLNTAIASSFTSNMTSTMDHAEIVDDTTVKLVLKHPFSPILGCLVSSNCAIVPKAAYEADPESFNRNPIGAGPYMLVDEKSGETATYDAFPDYWRGEAPIKQLILRVIPDDAAALMAFESGDLDMMQPSQAYTDRQAIIDNPKFEYYERPQTVVFGMFFNTQKGPFQDLRVRQAVMHTVDRDDLILGAVNGMATPTLAPMVPTVPQYPDDFTTYEKDIDKAKALMADAGYENGFDITMPIISAANYTKPAEILQAQLKEIGINLKIEPMERGTWFDTVMTGGNHEVTFYALGSLAVLDADFSIYTYFHSTQGDGNGMNLANYANPDVDKLIEDGRKSTDEGERMKIYREICELINEDAAFMPCYTGLRTVAAVKELNGVYADPMMRYYVYNYSW